MKIHANARTTFKTRTELVGCVLDRGWPKARAARAFGVSPPTVAKWVARYEAEGAQGLEDRSSAPRRIPHRTSGAVQRRIERLRRRGLRGWQIAERLQMAVSTVSAVLRRLGLGRGWDRRREPVIRYEWKRPGDLLHIDVKKLGRFREAGHRVGHRHFRTFDAEFPARVSDRLGDLTSRQRTLELVGRGDDASDRHGRRVVLRLSGACRHSRPNR